MITDYGHIVQGLPVMFLLVVVAMAVVIGAMVMDAVYGWRKACIKKKSTKNCKTYKYAKENRSTCVPGNAA